MSVSFDLKANLQFLYFCKFYKVISIFFLKYTFWSNCFKTGILSTKRQFLEDSRDDIFLSIRTFLVKVCDWSVLISILGIRMVKITILKVFAILQYYSTLGILVTKFVQKWFERTEDTKHVRLQISVLLISIHVVFIIVFIKTYIDKGYYANVYYDETLSTY